MGTVWCHMQPTAGLPRMPTTLLLGQAELSWAVVKSIQTHLWVPHLSLDQDQRCTMVIVIQMLNGAVLTLGFKEVKSGVWWGVGPDGST
jgi:hypothetical protein